MEVIRRHIKRALTYSIDNLLSENENINSFIIKYENHIMKIKEFISTVNNLLWDMSMDIAGCDTILFSSVRIEDYIDISRK